MDDLKEFAEKNMKIASESFLASGQLLPMWIADTTDGAIVIASPFHGDRSKDAVVAKIREEIAPKASRLLFMAESWMRVLKEKDVYDGVPPSQAADRIEVIYLFAEDRTGRAIHISREIIRANGTVTLAEPKMSDTKDGEGSVGGRFSGLLKDTGTAH